MSASRLPSIERIEHRVVVASCRSEYHRLRVRRRDRAFPGKIIASGNTVYNPAPGLVPSARLDLAPLQRILRTTQFVLSSLAVGLDINSCHNRYHIEESGPTGGVPPRFRLGQVSLQRFTLAGYTGVGTCRNSRLRGRAANNQKHGGAKRTRADD